MNLKEDTIIVIAFFIIFGMFLYFRPEYTGFTIYTPADYTYNSTLINISNNEIKLIPQITINFWNESLNKTVNLTNAEYTGDPLTKLLSIDGNILNLDKSDIFNVFFEENLSRYDLIVFYLNGTSANNNVSIYLCSYNQTCSSPGYGLLDYNGSEGYFYINLTPETETNKFNIDPPEKVKIDLIKAIKFYNLEKNSTALTYINSSIETKDFTTNNLSSFISLLYNHTLNNQSIIYEYSEDSGLTWNLVPENNSLTFINATKIRIKANLITDGTNTPIIHNISIDYNEMCYENWSCSEWSICTNSTEFKTRICNDLNLCSTQNSKPLEEMPCRYFKILQFDNGLINLSINATLNLTNISINFDNVNTSGNITNLTGINYFDINLSENINNNLIESKLILSYNQSEIESKGVNEATLELFYYNETSQIWDSIPSSLDIENNLIIVNISHFSTYGIFGKKGSSSGGSGSSPSSSPSFSLPARGSDVGYFPKENSEESNNIKGINENGKKSISNLENTKISSDNLEKESSNILTGEHVKSSKELVSNTSIGFIISLLLLSFAFAVIKVEKRGGFKKLFKKGLEKFK